VYIPSDVAVCLVVRVDGAEALHRGAGERDPQRAARHLRVLQLTDSSLAYPAGETQPIIIIITITPRPVD